MTRYKSPKLVLFSASLFLSACSSHLTQPDTTELAEAENLSNQLTLLTTQDESLDLNKHFFIDSLVDSQQVKTLLNEAFLANPDLQKSWLSLQLRQAEKRRVAGEALPTINADLSSSKTESVDQQFSGNLNIAWQVDLWGKLKDQTLAAAKQVEQQQFLSQAVQDTLAAEVIKSWLSLIAQQKAISIQRNRLTILEKNQTFITQRYRSGLGDSEDLSSARSAASEAQAELVRLQESLQQEQRSLQNLLGRTVRKPVEIPAQFPEVSLALAEQRLANRPDLKAAYLAIAAADLNRSVAYKDLLPSLNLSAALSETADSPSAALLLDPVWSLLAQLTAPLYQGGQLRAAKEIAELNVASAYQDYRSSLLTAVNELENAISLESSLQQRQQHIEAALSDAHDSLLKYQNRYKAGLATILDLLSVERNTYDLESQLNTLILQRLTNRIDLGLALGLPARSGATTK